MELAVSLLKKSMLLMFLSVGSLVFAQRFDIQQGGLKNLKGISQYHVAFDYNDIKIHGFESEEAYLRDKMQKREKVAGKAEKFREDWFTYRTQLYEPAFISYFNKSFKKGEIQVGSLPEAKYTMTIKTLWVYPGYNAGTAIEPAKITALVTITETQNPDNVLVKILFDKSIGLEHDLGNTIGDRISWAYEKIARNLSLQLKRFL